MSEAEPRRSVRSTKGQHKGLPETLDSPIEPNKRRGKKSAASKKQAEPEPEDDEEEVIRCVCGATSQETDDPDDPWIACDQCHVWQHNVCVNMSVYSEDLEDAEYFCEQCKPENHKELLEGMKKGRKLWEERRQEYDEKKAAEKQKKRGPRKGKKRQGEAQDDPRSSQKSVKSSASPAPERKTPAPKSGTTKRKERHDSADAVNKVSSWRISCFISRAARIECYRRVHDADSKTQEPSKLRKVSDTQAVETPQYEPPADLPETVEELESSRQDPTRLLQKSILHAMNLHEKKNAYNPADGVSNDSRALRLALAIERAIHDTHGSRAEYTKQCRLLVANLKSNTELIGRLLSHTLTPPMLAVMTSDDLKTEKQQQETAAAKERSVRQSVISTEEAQGPRYRRTHKGDELIENDGLVGATESLPQRQLPTAQKAGGSSRAQHGRKPSGEPIKIDTQQSPNSDFDINKVFSSVKSPTAAHRRRPSGPVLSQGPGVDPDVDRLLEDDGNDSDPYSPTEETDPDIVWRGQLIMAATADFQVVAKHVAGANLAKTLNLPWTTLLPRKLNVGGRIAMNSATEYLCSMRWNTIADLVVVSLKASTDAGKADFDRLFNYFVARERWAVIGDKGVGNVKDTYLVPVPAGTGNQPEFLLNLEDNFLPHTRAENLLLLVIVFKNDENTMRRIHGPEWNNKAVPTGQAPFTSNASPSPAPTGAPSRNSSVPGPAFSPTTPHPGAAGGFPPPGHGLQQHMQPGAVAQSAGYSPQVALTQEQQQQQGEATARYILGPYASATTLSFLMPHAHKMAPSEWQIIRRVLEREPKARDDLGVLGQLIARESENRQQQQAPPQQIQQQHSSQGVPAMSQSVSQQPSNVPALSQHQQAQHTPASGPQAIPAQPQSGSTFPAIKSNASSPTPVPVPPMLQQSQAQQQSPQQPPQQQNSPPPRQTPISLPPIPGMPASVHQSYQQAQAQANQARSGAPPA